MFHKGMVMKMGIGYCSQKFSFRVRNTPLIFGKLYNYSNAIKLNNGYLVC